MNIPPTAPAIPPMPTTEPTACFGNISEAIVKIFADQPWCAAAAMPIKTTAVQRFEVIEAKMIGTTASAQTSIAAFLDLLIVQPRLTDSTLHFIAGQPPIQRDLNVLLGKNVEAGRIVCGVTFSSEGNWTSFPPHEHAAMLEEAYLYIDMPAPSFGIQMVYTDFDRPELVQVVREGDVVLMPQGNHPNVAAPGGSINFLWMMAANREVVDRQFGVVNVQPEFDKGSSGLEAAHGKKLSKRRQVKLKIKEQRFVLKLLPAAFLFTPFI